MLTNWIELVSPFVDSGGTQAAVMSATRRHCRQRTEPTHPPLLLSAVRTTAEHPSTSADEPHDHGIMKEIVKPRWLLSVHAGPGGRRRPARGRDRVRRRRARRPRRRDRARPRLRPRRPAVLRDPTRSTRSSGSRVAARGSRHSPSSRLIEDGVLELTTTARSLLGSDLPLIDDAVTVEQLLAHRSGIGDYIDEDDEEGEITDYVLSRPVQELETTEGFLPGPRRVSAEVRTRRATSRTATGVSSCSRCSRSGRAASRSTSSSRRGSATRPGWTTPSSCAPTSSPRAPRSATSLPDGSDRTNVLHLPVLGNGDGGIYSTVADMHTFWNAFFGDQIVSDEWIAEMIRPRSDAPHGVEALRARLLAPPDERRGDARGLRRRRVVQDRPRSRDAASRTPSSRTGRTARGQSPGPSTISLALVERASDLPTRQFGAIPEVVGPVRAVDGSGGGFGSSHGTFEREQCGLGLDAAEVLADRAVAAHDPMARDDDRNRVVRACRPDRADCGRTARAHSRPPRSSRSRRRRSRAGAR